VGKVQHVRVAEPARHRDLRPIGKEPRTRLAAGLDLPAQHHIQTRLGRRRGEGARVAAVEHGPRVADGDEHLLLDGQPVEIVGGHVGEPQVGVGFDEAGHQGRARAVDHGGAVGGGRRRADDDLGDAMALDPYRAEVRFAAGGIEDPHVGDQVSHARAPLRGTTYMGVHAVSSSARIPRRRE
jgi:hypothetical protein